MLQMMVKLNRQIPGSPAIKYRIISTQDTVNLLTSKESSEDVEIIYLDNPALQFGDGNPPYLLPTTSGW